MKPYYTWKAIFDESIPNISQFEEDGQENLFSKIDENKDKLVKFRIEAEDKEYFEVDLVKGFINGNEKNIAQLDIPQGKKAELIYFRRNQERRDFKGNILEKRIHHHIGLVLGSEKKVIVVFPGLGMVEKKILMQSSNEIKKEISEENITKKV